MAEQHAAPGDEAPTELLPGTPGSTDHLDTEPFALDPTRQYTRDPGEIDPTREYSSPLADATALDTTPPAASPPAESTERTATPGSGTTSGQTVGPYRVIRTLGSGGYGTVYLGSLPDGTTAAVKTLRRDDAESRARFRREAELLARLEGAGYPRYLDGDPSGPAPWFAMEQIEGFTATESVRHVGPLTKRTALSTALDVAQALVRLHALGATHRDLKPDNVMLTRGRATVLDVGIAKGEEHEDLTPFGHVVGVIRYASPERALGRPATPLSDVYSLGMLLVTLSAGHPAIAASDAMLELRLALDGEVDLSGLDPALEPLVRQMVALDPSERPSMAEVVDRLRELLDAPAPAPPPEPEPLAAAQPSRSLHLRNEIGEITVTESELPAALARTMAEVEHGDGLWLTVSESADAEGMTFAQCRRDDDGSYEIEHRDGAEHKLMSARAVNGTEALDFLERWLRGESVASAWDWRPTDW